MTVSPFLLKMVKQSVLQRERGTEMVNPLCSLEPRVRRGMSGKDPLLACLSLNQAPKKTAQRADEQAGQAAPGGEMFALSRKREIRRPFDRRVKCLRIAQA